MNKKRIPAPAKKAEEYHARLPDWYWKNGLHDAEILSVSELEFAPDWKERHPKRNCLEIRLDGRKALFETNIKRIWLYNYRIVDMKRNASEPAAPEAFQNVYWLGDTIAQSEKGGFLLEIECTDSYSDRLYLAVHFESAETERR